MIKLLKFLFLRTTNKEIKTEQSDFNLWQEVWCVRNNEIKQVRIVKITMYGVYDQFLRKVFARAEYRVANLDYYSDYFGCDIDGKKLFRTKEELINSISGENNGH